MTTSKTKEALEAAGPATIEGVFALLRDVFRGGLAGAIAGVICLGVGSRVVMRVAALLDPDQHGRLTDNGNVIGAITFEGTLELVIFVGIFGGLATCAVWVLVRDWLPGELAPRMLLAGVIAAATGSFMVVDRENIDFALLEPTAANVAMFIGIVGLTGALAALFDRLLDARLPAGDAASAIWGGLAAGGGSRRFSCSRRFMSQPARMRFTARRASLGRFFSLRLSPRAWAGRATSAGARRAGSGPRA